jgi:hypothetical protein
MAISHANHDHPNTPAARAACRKRMAAGSSPRDEATERALAFDPFAKSPQMTVVPRRRGDGGVVQGMKAARPQKRAEERFIRTDADVPADLPRPLLYAIKAAWRRGWDVIDGYPLNDAERRILVGGVVAQVSLVWNAGGDSGVFVRKLTSSVTHRCDSAQQAVWIASGEDDWPWAN